MSGKLPEMQEQKTMQTKIVNETEQHTRKCSFGTKIIQTREHSIMRTVNIRLRGKLPSSIIIVTFA
jgi:hypothetical protein